MALKKKKVDGYEKKISSTLENTKKLPSGYLGIINQVLMKTNNKSKQKVSGGGRKRK